MFDYTYDELNESNKISNFAFDKILSFEVYKDNFSAFVFCDADANELCERICPVESSSSRNATGLYETTIKSSVLGLEVGTIEPLDGEKEGWFLWTVDLTMLAINNGFNGTETISKIKRYTHQQTAYIRNFEVESKEDVGEIICTDGLQIKLGDGTGLRFIYKMRLLLQALAVMMSRAIILVNSHGKHLKTNLNLSGGSGCPLNRNEGRLGLPFYILAVVGC